MDGNSHTGTEIKKSETNVLADAQRFALSLFNQKHDSRFVYHNYQFTNEVVKKTEEIARENSFSDAVIKEAKLTAWFYHLGLLFDYSNPIPKSSELLQKFLIAKGVPVSKTKNVVQIIHQIGNNQIPSAKTAQCLFDANSGVSFWRKFFGNKSAFEIGKRIGFRQFNSQK